MTKLNKSILETVRHNEIFENIKKKSFYGIQPSRAFKTAFVGGQPGSGKSTLTKNAENAFSYNAVIIDPDKLREFHPDYRKILQQDSRTAASLVHPDASAWAKELFNEAVKGNYNLILDGTMGNTGKIISQCYQLREAGYHTEVHLMAVNSLVSRMGIQNRYEKQIHNKGFGRWVDKEIHDEAFAGIPKTINHLEQEKLVDRITVYSRDNEVLYDNQLINGEWQHPPAALTVLETERNRNWLKDEHQKFSEDLAKVAIWMQERNAPASERELLADINRDYQTFKNQHTKPEDKLIYFVALDKKHQPNTGLYLPVYQDIAAADKFKEQLHQFDQIAFVYKIPERLATVNEGNVLFDTNAVKTEDKQNTPPKTTNTSQHNQQNEDDLQQ